MEETILKQLRGKSVILVTHGLQYLKYSDYIYVLDKGKIAFEGKFKDVQNSELYIKFLELDEVIYYLMIFIFSLEENLQKRSQRKKKSQNK